MTDQEDGWVLGVDDAGYVVLIGVAIPTQQVLLAGELVSADQWIPPGHVHCWTPLGAPVGDAQKEKCHLCGHIRRQAHPFTKEADTP